MKATGTAKFTRLGDAFATPCKYDALFNILAMGSTTMVRLLISFLLFILTASSAIGHDLYGAIAISPNNEITYKSWNYPSRREAEQVALAGCGKEYKGCVVATWASNACAAVITFGGTGWSSAWGSSVDEAVTKAAAAKVVAGRKYSVQASICMHEYWHEDDEPHGLQPDFVDCPGAYARANGMHICP